MSQTISFEGILEEFGDDLFAVSSEVLKIGENSFAQGAKVPDSLKHQYKLKAGSRYHVEAATGAQNKLTVRSLTPFK